MNKYYYELLDEYAQGNGIDLKNMNKHEIEGFAAFVCEHLNTRDIKLILSYIIFEMLTWN